MTDGLDAALAASECPVCTKAYAHEETRPLAESAMRRDISLGTADYERVCLFETGETDKIFYHKRAPTGGQR